MTGKRTDWILGETPPEELSDTVLRRLVAQGDKAAEAELKKRLNRVVYGPAADEKGPLETLSDAAVTIRALNGDEEAQAEILRRSPKI